MTGPEAIDLYMQDQGASNATVGHRWWLLQPAATTFASGNVPSSAGHPAANAVYVIDVNTFAPWPGVRDPAGVVAWPPRGYVPRPHVPERWSVFDDAIDFANATITVTVNGQPVTVVVDARGAGRAVWHYAPTLPAGELTAQVVITGGVGPGGVPVTLDYATTAFQPTADGGGSGPPPTTVDYQPVVPERLLDTRGGPRPAAGQTIELQVTGAGTRGIPADAVAVALNVTVTEPAAATYVTVWPCGQTRPTASNVNVAAGQTLPNLVVVRPGAGGKV